MQQCRCDPAGDGHATDRIPEARNPLNQMTIDFLRRHRIADAAPGPENRAVEAAILSLRPLVAKRAAVRVDYTGIDRRDMLDIDLLIPARGWEIIGSEDI